jgi:tape measure domain-containing protein
MSQTLSYNIDGNDRLSALLEKLDRTLTGLGHKFDGVTADARRMGDEFGNAENPTKRLATATDHTSSRMDAFATRLDGVMMRLRTYAVLVTTLATAAIASLGFMAVKTASDNEQASISFELLLGNAKKAKDFLAELQRFAAATPFDMPGLRNAASRLLAVGTATKDVVPLLTALGDATAGMGTGAEGIDRAVTALTQMRQKTKVTAEEMLQLTEAGIPAWQTLASFLKVDVATAMDMVTKRQVEAGVMFQALETKAGPAMQRLSGMMQRQSTTLAGIWSTFKDNASQALAKFAEPAIPALKKLVDSAGQATPKVLDKLRSMGSQLGGLFKGSDVPDKIMTALSQLGEKLLPELEAAWDHLLGTVRDNKEGLEKLGRFVADFVIPVMGSTLVASIEMVTGALDVIIWTAAHVVDAIRFMTGSFLDMLGVVIHEADLAFGWIPGLGPKLHKATQEFDDFGKNVMNKLDALDGREIKIAFKAVTTNEPAWAALRNAERQAQPRAAGGPTWAGQAYESNEFGPERWIAATTGTVQPYRANGDGGGAAGDVFQLDVTIRTEDGRVVHQKLLQFKRDSGKRSLEL